MNLVSVSIESIRIGSPLPFALRDEDGEIRYAFIDDVARAIEASDSSISP